MRIFLIVVEAIVLCEICFESFEGMHFLVRIGLYIAGWMVSYRYNDEILDWYFDKRVERVKKSMRKLLADYPGGREIFAPFFDFEDNLPDDYAQKLAAAEGDLNGILAGDDFFRCLDEEGKALLDFREGSDPQALKLYLMLRLGMAGCDPKVGVHDEEFRQLAERVITDVFRARGLEPGSCAAEIEIGRRLNEATRKLITGFNIFLDG